MISNLLGALTVVSGLLMITAILLQARGASLGAGFGSTGELYTTRRGTDKSLFDVTIVLATIFVGSILASIIIS